MPDQLTNLDHDLLIEMKILLQELKKTVDAHGLENTRQFTLLNERVRTVEVKQQELDLWRSNLTGKLAGFGVVLMIIWFVLQQLLSRWISDLFHQ